METSHIERVRRNIERSSWEGDTKAGKGRCQKNSDGAEVHIGSVTGVLVEKLYSGSCGGTEVVTVVLKYLI